MCEWTRRGGSDSIMTDFGLKKNPPSESLALVYITNLGSSIHSRSYFLMKCCNLLSQCSHIFIQTIWFTYIAVPDFPYFLLLLFWPLWYSDDKFLFILRKSKTEQRTQCCTHLFNLQNSWRRAFCFLHGTDNRCRP